MINLEPIRKVILRDKATQKVKAVLKADPKGFFTLGGGLLACGRCGCAVIVELSENHFKVCRHVWNWARDRNIIIPGEE